MRKVPERLEAMAILYFLMGSEALARYGQPRQTMDVDIVAGIATKDFDRRKGRWHGHERHGMRSR